LTKKYEYRIKPFEHQRKEFEEHGSDAARANFSEQGTGKTKIIIDSAVKLYLQKKISALLIIAPNGVHRNWVVEELPKHLPLSVLEEVKMHVYKTVKSKTKQHQRSIKTLCMHNGFSILAISYDAIMTDIGRQAVLDFFKNNKDKCFYVADESARIKNPNAKRTMRVLASSKYAIYRRILTGTPIANSPFDIYSQLKFLEPDFWKQHGISTFTGFKSTFGIWERKQNKQGQRYDELVAYKHMDRLKEMIDSISVRVTKDEVLDLPPKLYTKRFFELTDKQFRLYKELVEEFMTYLDGEDEMITAPLAIVRLLRLQQVCCGYLPLDSDEEGAPLREICSSNPRLDLLKELTEDLSHKAIIWARFTRDIDLICGLLGSDAVRYDGQTDDEERAAAIEAFQHGEAKFFVANAQAAGEGLTLTAARTVIYYSNSFKLTERLQSEDRAHRIGQEHPVNYIDLIAEGTIDVHIVSSLAAKLDLARQITGDKIRDWL